MSGFLKVDNNMPLKDFKIILKQLSEESITEIVSQWADIFGSLDPGFAERLNDLRNKYQSFWDVQIKYVQKLKSEKIAKLEVLAKETYELEHALGLHCSSSSSLADVPLVELEDQQIKLLNEYQELKEKRLAQFHGLQKRIEELSSILGYTTDLNSTCKDYGTSTFNTNKYSEIPSTNDLLRCSQIVDDLESKKINLEIQFFSLKDELRLLLNECEIKPFTKIERFACSLDGEYELPYNKQNLNNLQEHIQKYVSMKQSLKVESLELRNEIISLSRKMLKNEGDTQQFLLQHQGLRRSVLDELKKKLKLLKGERKEKIKELILKQRKVLDDLWTKCCYTAEQRMQFFAYNANYYTEDILSLHELEVEQLQNFYYNNKAIFNLASQHNELWERLLQLEDMAKRSDRLFHNRGGQLLKEEKERKIVQKKLPTVRRELINMLQKYKSTEGKDFLYDGVALLESLEQLEADRQATKENERQQRKTAQTNSKTAPAVINKRRLLTPQAVVCPKLVKVVNHTSATTVSIMPTPSNIQSDVAITDKGLLKPQMDNSATNYNTAKTPLSEQQATSIPMSSSPSYESFQQHINEVDYRDYLNSTKYVDHNLLKSTSNAVKSPYRICTTPNRSPSKMPFRIATGLKIPPIVQPLSRSASRSKTPRSKLPIIF